MRRPHSFRRLAVCGAVLAVVACREIGSPPTAPGETAGPAAASALAPLVFRYFSPGQYHTCGVTTGQRGYCWGVNAAGDLGNGTMTRSLVPAAVGGSLALARMTLGERHACGVTTADKGYCWGEGRLGRIGDGGLAQRLLPSPVTAPGN